MRTAKLAFCRVSAALMKASSPQAPIMLEPPLDKNGNVTNEFREEDKVYVGKNFNAPWQGGFGTAFNAQTYDETMQNFFQYMCENYGDVCYNDAQVFSPFNGDIPEGVDQMFYDLQPLFATATDAWVCREMYLKLMRSEKNPLVEEENL